MNCKWINVKLLPYKKYNVILQKIKKYWCLLVGKFYNCIELKSKYHNVELKPWKTYWVKYCIRYRPLWMLEWILERGWWNDKWIWTDDWVFKD